MQSTQVMYDQDIKRWGLHHLDPRGGRSNTGNDYRSYDTYTFLPYETPESQYMNPSPAEVDNNTANNETPETSETHEPQLRNLLPAEVDNNIANDETPETSQTPEPQLINLSPAELDNNVPTNEAVSHNNIANDEAIARLLQEELSKLAAEEAKPHDSAQSFDGSSKAAVLSQDWQGSPAFNSSNREISNTSQTTGKESEGQADGGAGGYEQSGLTNDSQAFPVDNNDSMGPRKQGSSSSLRSDSRGKTMSSSRDYDAYQYGDDDENLNLALALSEEHERDEEVAKRLSKLDSIRHVPRINADVMPTVDVASLDHARLMERLILYGLNERKIQGDGNCQFRALSDQLYHEPEHHKFVRKSIVAQLKAHPDVYSGYVPMAYGEYLKKMAKSGEWGDHVTLQAAADSYGLKIWLITSFKSTSFIEILPENQLSNRVIYLSFWAEVHYNSIYPEGEYPGGTVW